MISLAVTLLLAATPVVKGSGEQMCVLAPADFHAVGLVVNKPQVGVDDGGNSAYCTYRGLSGAKGGVELDVFYSAGASSADIDNTWRAILGSNPGAAYQHEGLQGVDESVYSLSIPQPGYPNFAANAVRRGDLVFAISMPSTPKTKDALDKLSAVVLERISK
jgi:hypothetical protein